MIDLHKLVHHCEMEGKHLVNYYYYLKLKVWTVWPALEVKFKGPLGEA